MKSNQSNSAPVSEEKLDSNTKSGTSIKSRTASISRILSLGDSKVRQIIIFFILTVLLISLIVVIAGSFYYNIKVVGSHNTNLKPIDLGNIVSFIFGHLFGILSTVITYYFRSND